MLLRQDDELCCPLVLKQFGLRTHQQQRYSEKNHSTGDAESDMY
jgi:hypothetical protein